MALEPFRFVHADSLRLDAPLVGLAEPAETVLDLAENATLQAFERVVAGCLRHQPEFLLLTGPIWSDSLTPAAWHSFAAGCEALTGSGIRVFWAGGPANADENVRQMLAELPSLTLMPVSDPDPVAIIREGRVIASLSTCDERAARFWSASSMPVAPGAATAFHIRVLLQSGVDGPLSPAVHEVDDHAESELVPLLDSSNHAGINYLALTAGARRLLRTKQNSVLHQPGPAQGIVPAESGPHGCSLVEVDPHGACRVEFLPTAVVRWEQLRMGVERGMSRSQLIDDMQQMLLDRETSPGEQLLCVHWLLVGSGPLFEELQASGGAASISADIDAGLPRCAELNRRHVFELRPRIGADDDATVQDFFDVLGEIGFVGLDELRGVFECHGARPWSHHVIRSLQRQDFRAVADTAARLGQEWLQNQRHVGG